jgi:hypothetical protein
MISHYSEKNLEAELAKMTEGEEYAAEMAKGFKERDKRYCGGELTKLRERLATREPSDVSVHVGC